jgi:hypothetical protein
MGSDLVFGFSVRPKNQKPSLTRMAFDPNGIMCSGKMGHPTNVKTVTPQYALRKGGF